MRLEQGEKRILWIDVLKFACMFFIMHNHMNNAPPTQFDVFEAAYSPFFLLGFFFASGYVYKRAPFKTFIKKKVIGVFVPWAAFAVILPLVKTVVLGGNGFTSLIGNLLQIRGESDSLWFLAALFISFIPFYFIEKYLSRKKGLILCALLTAASAFYVKFAPQISYNILGFSAETNSLPWHLESVFAADFFMLLGLSYRGRAEEYTEKFVKPQIFLAVFAAYLAVVITYFSFTGEILGLNSYGGKDVYSFFIWIVAVSLGLVSLVLFSKLLKPNKFILYVGAHTLLFYALHIEIENFILHIPGYVVYGWYNGQYLSLLNILDDFVLDEYCGSETVSFTICNTVAYLVIYSATIVISMAVVSLPVYVIENFFPFLVGKRYPFKTKAYLYRVRQFFSSRSRRKNEIAAPKEWEAEEATFLNIAYVGEEALALAVEAYINKFGEKAAREKAAIAVKTVFENLPAAYSGDGAAKENILSAYSLSKEASLVNLGGYASAVSRVVGDKYLLPRGYVSAAALPATLKKYGKKAEKRLSSLASAVGMEGEDASTLAAEFVEKIEELGKICQIPSKIVELKEEDVPSISSAAIKEGNPACPVPVEWDEKAMAELIYSLTV